MPAQLPADHKYHNFTNTYTIPIYIKPLTDTYTNTPGPGTSAPGPAPTQAPTQAPIATPALAPQPPIRSGGDVTVGTGVSAT